MSVRERQSSKIKLLVRSRFEEQALQRAFQLEIREFQMFLQLYLVIQLTCRSIRPAM